MNALVRQHLLPLNSTPLERAVSETLDRTPELAQGTEALHAFKYRLPNNSILPWLVQEYGLGPITPYFAVLSDVIAHGIPWSRQKGTPKAIEQALDWLRYAYTTLDEAPTRRRRWHLFALELDRFWDRESDLDIIEAVGRLSQPARSEFFRGWHGYDVRGLEWSYSRLGDSIVGDSSGVRLHDGGVKWSFGRVHEMTGGSTDLTMRHLQDLGVWTMPTGSGALGWGAFPWDTPGLTWTSSGAETWAQVVATGLLPKTCWLKLKRADGSVIGYRRARAWHAVVPAAAGVYRVGGSRYDTSPTGTSRLYVEAMTDFGEGDGEQPAQWSVVIGGALPAGAKPGVMWLAGDALVGGIEIGGYAFAGGTVFGKTARERLRGLLRLDAGSVFDGEPAGMLLGHEAAGAALHFAADQHLIRDPGNPANNKIATTDDLIADGTIVYARNTPASNWGRLGVMETVAANKPRLAYDPASVVTSTSTVQFRRGKLLVPVAPGYTYTPGKIIALTSTADPAKWMRATVEQHSGAVLLVDVYWLSPAATGSASAWTIIESVGYLPEPFRSNLLTRSREFEQWSSNPYPNDTSVTADAGIAPDGTLTADYVIPSNGNGSHYRYRTYTGAINTAYVFSCFFKAGPTYKFVNVRLGNSGFPTDMSVIVDLTTGAISTPLGGITLYGALYVGNGWWYTWVGNTSDADGGNYVASIVPCISRTTTVSIGDGTGIYAWGAQVEAGTYPTSYIATSNGAVGARAHSTLISA